MNLRLILSAFEIALAFTFLLATPPGDTKPRPKEEKKSKYPTLPKECNWGSIVQFNHQIVLNGSQWDAEGYWHHNKKTNTFTLVLFWVQVGVPERVAPSVYKFDEKGGMWVGQWLWEDNGYLETETALLMALPGHALLSDTIREVKRDD